VFPFDKKDRIRRPSMFGDFDSFFADFEGEMTRMMQDSSQPGSQHFVYGYRSYTGPDGKPQVEEYSNVPGFKGFTQGLPAMGTGPQSAVHGLQSTVHGLDREPKTEDSVEEPYYDVINVGDKLKLIVELPGLEKKDIKVQSHGRYVSIKAKNETRNFECDIPVPDYVEAKPKSASYKNGILEITYGKSQDKPTDVKVD